MTGEVDDFLSKAKLLENGPHRCLVGVDTFHGFGVILIKVGDEDQEFSEAPFLKQTHQTFRRHKVQTLSGGMSKESFTTSTLHALMIFCGPIKTTCTNKSKHFLDGLSILSIYVFILNSLLTHFSINSPLTYWKPGPQSQWRALYRFCPLYTRSSPQSP